MQISRYRNEKPSRLSQMFATVSDMFRGRLTLWDRVVNSAENKTPGAFMTRRWSLILSGRAREVEIGKSAKH